MKVGVRTEGAKRESWERSDELEMRLRRKYVPTVEGSFLTCSAVSSPRNGSSSHNTLVLAPLVTSKYLSVSLRGFELD